MPHDIAVINGKAAMAYQNEEPWHGLGTHVEEMDNVEDALKAANLDWHVNLEPMFLSDGARVPNRQAVVRDIDLQILGTVGDGYFPIQNFQAMGVLDGACREHGAKIETAGALGKGERVWMLAKLPEPIEPIPGDKIEQYFLILTGHDGATPHIGLPTPVRVVCRNTLEMALLQARGVAFRLTHQSDQTENLKVVEKLINHMITQIYGFGQLAQEMYAKRLTIDDAVNYVRQVLQIKGELTDVSPLLQRRHATILNLGFNGKGADIAGATEIDTTLWAAYNGVTEYIDHVRPAETKNGKSRLKANLSALFGANAVVKARALNVAKELIGA